MLVSLVTKKLSGCASPPPVPPWPEPPLLDVPPPLPDVVPPVAFEGESSSSPHAENDGASARTASESQNDFMTSSFPGEPRWGGEHTSSRSRKPGAKRRFRIDNGKARTRSRRTDSRTHVE